jgi:Tol biopolymer transport system component
MRKIALLAALFTQVTAAGAQQKRTITFDDFAAVRAVSDPQPSSDGRSVLYSVRVADVQANRRNAKTFLIPSAGGAPQVFPSADVAATEARWSPDGKRVAYVADGQLWIADASGANAKKLTELDGGATGPVWSPLSDRIAFTSAVYPECSNDACNAAKSKAAAESKVKAHIADQLMFRHWNAWDEGTRSHLFVVGGGTKALAHTSSLSAWTAARHATSCPAQSTPRLWDRLEAPRTTAGRRMGASCRTPRRTKAVPTRGRPMSISTPCPRTAARQQSSQRRIKARIRIRCIRPTESSSRIRPKRAAASSPIAGA